MDKKVLDVIGAFCKTHNVDVPLLDDLNQMQFGIDNTDIKLFAYLDNVYVMTHILTVEGNNASTSEYIKAICLFLYPRLYSSISFLSILPANIRIENDPNQLNFQLMCMLKTNKFNEQELERTLVQLAKESEVLQVYIKQLNINSTEVKKPAIQTPFIIKP